MQTRREFMAATTATAMGVGLGIPTTSVARTSKQVSANDKIIFGLIGCGGMGAANMRNFMGHADVEVGAICDVDSARMPADIKAIQDKYDRTPEIYSDYRKMLERKDLDAIIIGSPDHWHALNLIHACEAGKDIYCEKPISRNIVEANAMIRAKNHFERVVQVGTWQRSGQEFADAIAYIRSGKLGKITHCRAWIADGTKLGRTEPVAPPETMDYDMWIGPAEMVPYKSNCVHYNWRWMLNIGGGLTTDWGVHMMDIALLGMSADQDLVMPTEVSAYGGQWAFPDDDRDAPDSIEAIYRFADPDFVMTWSVLRDYPGKPSHGTEFVSVDGRTVRVWRGGWTILDPSGKELEKEGSEPVPTDHWRNFLDCVKTREKPRADLDSAGQTTIVCHLSNAALFSGETVKWSKDEMDIVGTAGKDTSAYDREYRGDWSLTKY
ncbi:MAG: Gfo/Idh/MocA family oxidoreductase [Fimbriimonadaceae bacterium]|nr:Gfo/Idh/MocA family oxidoreductase [Fimbriimonadaceae bacterium]